MRNTKLGIDELVRERKLFLKQNTNEDLGKVHRKEAEKHKGWTKCIGGCVIRPEGA